MTPEEQAVADAASEATNNAANTESNDNVNAAETTENAQAVKSVEITDDVLYTEIAKRFADKGINSKEDFEAVINKGSQDYSNHIQVKNPLVKGLNDWAGDPEVFFKIQKLDVDALDNKAAIIENIKISEGVNQKLAEAIFNEKYGNAMVDAEDEDFDKEDPKYLLALHNLEKDARNAKDSLAKWKVSEMEKGQQKIDPNVEIEREQRYQENWAKPIQNAMKDLQKLDFSLDFELPDKTKVSEPFSYGVGESQEIKAAVQDILLSKSSDEFMAKMITRYGMAEDGKTPDLAKLAGKLAALESLPSLIQQIASTASSKAIAHHLATLKPGDLSKDKFAGGQKTTSTPKVQNMIDAMNAKALKEMNS